MQWHSRLNAMLSALGVPHGEQKLLSLVYSFIALSHSRWCAISECCVSESPSCEYMETYKSPETNERAKSPVFRPRHRMGLERVHYVEPSNEVTSKFARPHFFLTLSFHCTGRHIRIQHGVGGDFGHILSQTSTSNGAIQLSKPFTSLLQLSTF